MHSRYEINRHDATIDTRLSFWDLQGNLFREAKLAPDRAHAHTLSGDAGTVVFGTGPNFGFMSRPVTNEYLRSTIRLCDAASGKELVKVDDVPCQINNFTLSPDDRFLFVDAFNAGPNPGDYHHIDSLQIWKRSSATKLEKIGDIPMQSFLSGYRVSPDSRWVVATSKEGYQFHDCETGKLIRHHPNTPDSAVAVSPSGRVLVSEDAHDGRGGDTVFVWEQATGKTICTLDCKPGQTNWAPLVVSPDGRYVAGCLEREVICLWDAFTGKQLGKLEGHRGDISSLCFSADGQALVSASADTTILVWDWKKKLPKVSEKVDLSAERVAQLWQDLQASDPQRAYLAIQVLLRSPGRAIELLKTRALADNKIDRHQFKQWIAELDDDRFAVRENAMKELIDSGELAEAALRDSLAGGLSLEAAGRVTRVLDKLPVAAPHPTTLAALRSLELLELMNTPEARTLIEEMSRDAGDPIRKREAELTLKRVKR